MLGSIGAPEILIVLVLALIVLGPKRLPEAGRGIGRGLREFKDAVTHRDALPGDTAQATAQSEAV